MIEFHVTFDSPEDAQRVAHDALGERLAACVNIIDGVRSLYWWEGDIEDATETLVIFKTSEARADALQAFIEAHHPYDTPAIIRTRPESANEEYSRWVDKETA